MLSGQCYIDYYQVFHYNISITNKGVYIVRIIAIEGLDKAGKKTSTDTLELFFNHTNIKVARYSLPNYNKPIGKLIKDWLNGDFEADAKVFELLQTADKQYAQEFIKKCEDDDVDVLIMDRYIHSLLAYGAYDNNEDWLEELTKHMRMPDTVIYLDVEPEVSMHRNGKFGDNDKYESDLDRLRSTGETYKRILKGDVRIVDANKPPLIVKSRVLQIGIDIYEEMMDRQIEGNTKRKFITPKEKDLIKLYNAFN